jgi:hypothetical protein
MRLTTFQVAHRGLQRAQQVDGDGARRGLAFGGAHGQAELADPGLAVRLAMWPEMKTRLPVRTKGT